MLLLYVRVQYTRMQSIQILQVSLRIQLERILYSQCAVFPNTELQYYFCLVNIVLPNKKVCCLFINMNNLVTYDLEILLKEQLHYLCQKMSKLHKIDDLGQEKTDEEEEKYWHRLASVLNLLVSVVYIVTQVVILIVNLGPCLLARKD